MESPPDTNEHLAGAIKRLLWRVMAVGQNRAELLMVEMQEERARAQVIVFLAAGIAVFGILACFTLTALIVCACVSHLLLALGLIAGFYGLCAFVLYLKLSNMLRHWETLSSTREQFEKDRECLEKATT